MKKHIFILPVVVGILMLLCMGCTSKKSLTISEGVLCWGEVKNATNYIVDIDDISIACEEAKLNLAEACEYEGDYTVTVSSVSAKGKKKEIGSVELTMQSIEIPKISVKEEEDQSYFVWETKSSASGYIYDLHDGDGKRDAEILEDKTCRVAFDGALETIITVDVQGNSRDNVIYMDNTVTYHFDGTELFSMAELAKYPFHKTTDGQLLNELVVGTTLAKGNYDLEISFRLMDLDGRSLSGNGAWGRRITHLKGNTWFCANEVEGWAGSGGTLPKVTEEVTYVCNQNVNKYGETILSLYSWSVNEMCVITDVKYNGKSVMAEGLTQHNETPSVFDVSKLEDYVAIFKGTGRGWHEDFKEEFELNIPTNLEDGVYKVEIAYQIMNEDGTGLEGNGTGMRRIYDADMKQVEWLCEYAIEGQTDGYDNMPSSEDVLKTTFQATVVDGHFKIMCLHFKTGELLAVKSVKRISGSSRHFDLTTLDKYKNVHIYEMANSVHGSLQKMRVATTKCERVQVEVEVSYYAMSGNGYMLSGNGTWGRRIVCEGADEHWLCETMPSAEHPDAEGTLPYPDELVTQMMTVTLNKAGTFFLDLYDFADGEIIVIKDVKYNGKSILKK